MSTHDNIFDRLLHELQEGDMALADGCRVRIEGSVGQRKAYFLMEEGSYEEGMISDPSWIIDTMRDDIGMRAEELRYKAHDHEYGTEHKLIVGQLQDEGGWALYLMGDLDETGDASGKCRIELIEGATQVQALIDSLNNGVSGFWCGFWVE